MIILHKNICCGYSLELPWRGDSNEHPQHMFLWITDENYPSIIVKYPPYLFFCQAVGQPPTCCYSISLDLPDVPGHVVDYLGCRHTQGTGVKVAAVARWLESLTLNEPVHDKTNKMTCAPSEDSDQPGHPPSLIRVVAVRVKKPWVLSYPYSD